MSERGRLLCITCGYWVATCGYQCEACALDQHRHEQTQQTDRNQPDEHHH
jgi:predicted amidophosphoribosyltransferase